jgi:hypothetical protein
MPGGKAWAVIACALGCGLAAGGWLRSEPPKALAVATAVQDSFAVCTAPVNDGTEGVFILDFETGDVSGGVLNPTSAKFMVGYRHNVLRDVGFKPGKVKNPKFLLVPGQATFAGPDGGNLGPSVLYVTDVATGVTAAYGVPWTATAVGVNPLVLLDVVRPRGGGDKAP